MVTMVRGGTLFHNIGEPVAKPKPNQLYGSSPVTSLCKKKVLLTLIIWINIRCGPERRMLFIRQNVRLKPNLISYHTCHTQFLHIILELKYM